METHDQPVAAYNIYTLEQRPEFRSRISPLRICHAIDAEGAADPAAA